MKRLMQQEEQSAPLRFADGGGLFPVFNAPDAGTIRNPILLMKFKMLCAWPDGARNGMGVATTGLIMFAVII